VRLVIAVAWLAAAGSARIVLAQSGPPRAHLSVQGPTCANAAALQAAVHKRSARIAFVPAQPGVLLLEAALAERAPGEWQAELIVPGPRRSERQLLASSCAEAVDALGLLIAMTLDPALADAQVTPLPVRPARTIKTTPPPTEPTTPPTEPVAPIEPEPEPEPAPAPQTTTAPPAEEQQDDPSSPATSQLGAGLSAQLTFGPTPTAMPGIALDLYWALERDSIWAPALRLRAAHGFGVSVTEPLGKADFALDVGGLDLCPVRLPLGPAALRACASGTFGRLGASGYDTYEPSPSSRFFGSLGGSLWLVLPIFGSFQLQASASLGAALLRDTYEFTPAKFHQVSALHFDLGLGLGLRFL
jgi:hypothetical protein